MDLRITPQTTLATILAQIAAETTQLGKIQQQAATGKKVLTPSDDPDSIGSLLANKAQDSRLDAYLNNIHASQASLNVSTSALQDAGSILTQARTLALQGAQSTEDAQSRGALAEQIDRLLGRLLDFANTQQAGRYLFAGQASQTKPFVVTTDSAGNAIGISYVGAGSHNAVPITPDQTVPTLYSGAQIFQARQRGPSTITGSTGAAPGAGTDNSVGAVTLQVRHTLTTYASGSGIQPGASSATGDTILGPAGAHRLNIVDTSGTGAAGTISLDGGPPIAFTSADTNLAITGPGGAQVFVDASAITAGFNGTVDITADGTLSVDGGASTIPIDFSANQAVTDSGAGAVTNIDSTNIRATGDDQIDHPGTYDAFQTLMALRDDLRNTRGLSEGDQIQSISARIGELDRIHENVLSAVGEQSASLQNLDSLESRLRDVQLTTKQLISNLEDADVSQLVVQLQANQNMLTLTLATAAKLQDQSFLDFMK